MHLCLPWRYHKTGVKAGHDAQLVQNQGCDTVMLGHRVTLDKKLLLQQGPFTELREPQSLRLVNHTQVKTS